MIEFEVFKNHDKECVPKQPQEAEEKCQSPTSEEEKSEHIIEEKDKNKVDFDVSYSFSTCS